MIMCSSKKLASSIVLNLLLLFDSTGRPLTSVWFDLRFSGMDYLIFDGVGALQFVLSKIFFSGGICKNLL